MAMARQALAGNSLQSMRLALAAVYALQVQTELQRAKRARRPKLMGTCVVCGQPIVIDRRRKPGQPNYCRGTSRCRQRAYWRRKMADQDRPDDLPDGRGQRLSGESPGLRPSSGAPQAAHPAEVPSTPPAGHPDPVNLWLAMHRG